MLKFFRKGGLEFVMLEDTDQGFRAFESKHSLMVSAGTREELIEEIKKEVIKHFGEGFFDKVALKETVMHEIKL